MEIQAFNFFSLYWLHIFVVAILGYLLGSISFSILFTNFFKNKSDIRTLGSGNAGFTNVLRSVGIVPAIFTMLGDFGKGIVACLIGKWLLSTTNFPGTPEFCIVQYGAYIAGVACVIGHMYPCFFGFRGGKSVLTAFSMIIVTDLRVALFCLTVFLVATIITRIVSLGSILAAISYPVGTLCFTYFFDYLNHKPQVTFGYVVVSVTVSLFVGLFVLYKHKKNLVRILKGEEKKISMAKK